MGQTILSAKCRYGRQECLPHVLAKGCSGYSSILSKMDAAGANTDRRRCRSKSRPAV